MNRRQLLATAGVAGLAGCLSVLPGSCPDKYEWCHSVAASVSAVSQGVVFGIEANPSEDGGVFANQSEDGSVFALDRETGERQWDYGQGDGYEWFDHLYATDAIYVIRGDDHFGGEIHALNYDGTERWETRHGRVTDVQLTPEFAYIGDGGMSTGVRIFRKTDGEQSWRYNLTEDRGWDDYGTPQITLTNELLYIDGEELLAVDVNDHTIEWTYGDGHGHIRVGAIIEGVAYVSTSGGIAAVAAGEEHWSVDGEAFSMLVATTDAILVRSQETGVVRAFDLETGEERWQSEPIAPGEQVRTAQYETVLSLLTESWNPDREEFRLFALGLSEGDLRWERTADDRILKISTEGPTQGHEVYISSDKNRLERIDSDGQVTWSETVEGPMRRGALLVDEGIVVGTDQGVYALDTPVGH